MVSSCDRRIGDVPAASDMNSSSSSGWIRNYKFGRTARATNRGNQYGSRHSRADRLVCHRRDAESFPFCHSISVLPPDPQRKAEEEGSTALGALYVLCWSSESAGMAYDFASRQSRIRSPSGEKRETG